MRDVMTKALAFNWFSYRARDSRQLYQHTSQVWDALHQYYESMSDSLALSLCLSDADLKILTSCTRGGEDILKIGREVKNTEDMPILSTWVENEVPFDGGL